MLIIIVCVYTGRHGLLHEHEHQVQQEEAGASPLHCSQTEVEVHSRTVCCVAVTAHHQKGAPL